MSRTILEVTDLRKEYKQRRGLISMLTGQGRVIPAVDGVSFYLRENETVGLVGESGCGKTTIGRTVLRLTDPSSGRIVFDGRDIGTCALCGRKLPIELLVVAHLKRRSACSDRDACTTRASSLSSTAWRRA